MKDGKKNKKADSRSFAGAQDDKIRVKGAEAQRDKGKRLNENYQLQKRDSQMLRLRLSMTMVRKPNASSR